MCAKCTSFGAFTPFWLADLENSPTYAHSLAFIYSTTFSPQHSSLRYILKAFSSRCANKLRCANKMIMRINWHVWTNECRSSCKAFVITVRVVTKLPNGSTNFELSKPNFVKIRRQMLDLLHEYRWQTGVWNFVFFKGVVAEKKFWEPWSKAVERVVKQAIPLSKKSR